MVLKMEVFVEVGEGVDVVEVVDGVGGLGAHPLICDHKVDDLAEVASGTYAPASQDGG